MKFKVMIAIAVVGCVVLFLLYNYLTGMQCSGFKNAATQQNCNSEIVIAIIFMLFVIVTAGLVIRHLTKEREDVW